MVSIIIPIYNRENYIVKCVNSILNQTYKDIEIILVNDGSTDNSLEIMADLAATDKRIRIIDKPNGGTSTAVAVGVQNAAGEYITFVDSDDYVGETLIENYLKVIEDFDVVCMGYYEDNGEIIEKPGTSGVFSGDSIKHLLYDWSPITSLRWGKLYKREILLGFVELYKLLNLSACEDIYFTYLLNYTICQQVGGKIKSVSEPNCYFYVIHTSITHKNFNKHIYENEINSFYNADEIVNRHIGQKCYLANWIIYDISVNYIKMSKYRTEISKKDALKIIEIILSNNSFQNAVKLKKSNGLSVLIKKILFKFKLSKLVYLLF